MRTNKSAGFADHIDPELAQIEERLQTIYTARTRPDYPSWSQLQAKHAASEGGNQRETVLRLRWVRPLPVRSRRYAPILAALALLLVLTAAAYGAASLILNQLAQSEPATHNLVTHDQFSALNQSTTIDGFTMTLEEAYADANRAILGIVVTKPNLTPLGNGGDWSFAQMSLKTADGVILPAGSFMLNDDAVKPGGSPSATFVSFDAENIQGAPSTLHLQAGIAYRCLSSASSSCSEKALSVANDLNWSFQFDVPFHPGRVASLHQSVTREGATMTLERVVVTPSETRAYITGLSYGNTDDRFSFSRLALAGKAYVANTAVPAGGWTNQGFSQGTEWSVSFFEPLFDSHGDWTLSVRVWKRGTGGACQCEGTPAGTWTFQFVVP
jgi:hypothetical protein